MSRPSKSVFVGRVLGLLLLLAALVLAAVPARAAPAIVQSGSCFSTTAQTCGASLLNTTGGNSLVVFEATPNGGSGAGSAACCSTPSDAAADSFIQVGATVSIGNPSGQQIALYLANNIAPSTLSVTCDVSTGNVATCVVYELSGVSRSDGTGTASGKATSLTTSSFTTTISSDLILAGVMSNVPGSFTAGSGFTLDVNVGNAGGNAGTEQTEHESVTVTGTYTAAMSWSFSTKSVMIAAAFGKPLVTCPKTLLTMGVGC